MEHRKQQYLQEQSTSEHEQASHTITLNLRFSPLRSILYLWDKVKSIALTVWREMWEAINRVEKVVLLRLPRPLALRLFRLRPKRRAHPVLTRLAWGFMALLMLSIIFIDTALYRGQQISYALSDAAQTLVPTPNQIRAASLRYNAQGGIYEYNKGYQPGIDTGGTAPGPKFSASVSKDLQSKGVVVTDPTSNVSMTITPSYATRPAEQKQNQLVYPLISQDGQKIYTFGAGAIKEDIVLSRAPSDKVSYAYKLSLSDGTEARLEKNGDIAVYGVTAALLGNVTTSSDKDAELLSRARQNSQKTTLLFTLPKPVVLEYGKKVSDVRAWFTLSGNEVVLNASGLMRASFPLTIDPTVYIETAQKLMLGNNETNTDFDVTNELIQKSQTTGARIDEWSSTSNLSSAVWQQGTAVAGGYIYTVGGVDGSSTTSYKKYAAGSYDSSTDSFTIPSGVTSVTIKTWGAGGGGGDSGGSGYGGAGGGGGYAKAVISVSTGDQFLVTVGSGGAGGSGNGLAGDGGGYSSVTLKSPSTLLVQAGAGGGGGGTRSNATGGAGGAGGGSNGVAGSNGSGTTPGGGGARGTTSAGGAGGSAGTGGTAGASGAAGQGGNGGGSASNNCSSAVTGRGGAGGSGGGGLGGTDTSSCSDGAGGGGGRYGGGGGGSSNSTTRGGGGGGGGSDYIIASGSSKVETAGSGTTPGNDADPERGTAGEGGLGTNSSGNTTSGTDGGVVISYTIPGVGTSSAVSWARFNSTNRSIESPNPGDGACSGWCSKSAYDLPTALKGLSLVAYNGYLYAIGGSNNSGTPQTTVYIAKLGANGEPQLWHPTDTNKNNWLFWYSDTALSNARSFFGAVAYNNRLYIAGGLTTSSTLLSSNTVQYANINPNGKLSGWASTGMQALTSARYGLTAQVYNDYLYVIGGNASFAGTPIGTVQYARLNTDGTMNAWQTTASLATSGRMTAGGAFSTIWGAYIYVGGGCTAVDGSGNCTTIASDVQLASINADGSLDSFNTILGLTNNRVGHTLIAWQGGLYRLGGCRQVASGTCTDTVLDVDYGVINPEGEASTVANSVASGSAPCSGGAPYGCDLPGVSVIGNVLNGSAIMNGYLYLWGGCSNTTSGCGTVSRSVAYTSIGSDGSLTKPASCGTWSTVDSYCYNTTSLPGTVGAPGSAIFNGYIYSVGGFTASGGVNQIYYAQPNTTNGSIASWSSVALSGGGGVGATNAAYTYAFARANPASAGSNPGNLYIIGGCSSPGGIGCSNYTQAVYKCNIGTSGAPASCSTANQLQIGIVPGDSQVGLGAMAGTVYANYIYLMGGLTPNMTDIKTTRYAKIDNSNNIVAVSGSSWIESANVTYYGRRRGAGFGYNGYLYVVGGYDGSGGGGGVLADIEFAKINVSDGSIGSWTVSSVSINQRWGLAVAVSNSYAYVVGGCISGSAPTCDAGGQTNSIQTFQIYNNNSGAMAGYSAGNTPGLDRIGGSSTILNGYIYFAGGCSDMACATLNKTVSYAKIDAYGIVDTWSVGNALPGTGGIAWGKLVNAGGTLYYLGGQTGAANTTAQSTVYYSTGFSSGNASWGTASKTITNTAGTAQARTQFSAAVWNDRLYVVGGYNATPAVQSTVLVSPQLSSGGNITTNWSSGSTAFNVARAGAATVAYANNLYVLGGFDGTNYLSDVQYSQLDGSNGHAGSWSYSTNLPDSLRDADAFAANGYIYIVGGRTAATTCRPVTLFAPISANTTIDSGNNPTGVGVWSETNQRYAGDRYGASTSYADGKTYTIGGGCSSMVAAVDRMYYSTVKSQPQVAKYSRMIDTDSDVFPNGWLMNGLDNSIGARWKARYRSSTTANASWGQETSVAGDIILGNVNPYVPYDGSGTNTSYARYYYLFIYIDASQTFGYPEDVTRGPTVADISLFYTADPSKRMIHGKTFIQGLQQPLDTPCRRGSAVPGDPNYNCPLP